MPKKNLTPQMIERMRAPRSGRIEVQDGIAPGLVLRVTSNGVKSFAIRYTVPGEGGVHPTTGRLRTGKQHRITLGNWPTLDLKPARAAAREVLEAASEGRDARIERREENITRHANLFLTVRKQFIELEMKPHVKKWQQGETVLRLHVEPAWAARPITDIRRKDIHTLLDKLVNEKREALAREVRKHLSRMFSWCLNREIITVNPMVGLDRKELRRKEAGRALTDDEIKRIWHATFDLGPFGACYRALLLTGQRRNEIAAASWSEIDSVKRLLTVPATRHKMGREMVVLLSAAAWAIFDGMPRWNEGDFVFSTRAGTIPISGFSTAKLKLDKASSVNKHRIHDFRVSCETRLASLGFNQEVRDAVLGHVKAGLQATYNKHQYLDEKRAALNAYAKHILQVVK